MNWLITGNAPGKCLPLQLRSGVESRRKNDDGARARSLRDSAVGAFDIASAPDGVQRLRVTSCAIQIGESMGVAAVAVFQSARMPSGSKSFRSPICCLTIRIIGPTIWLYPLRHGGLHGSTGSKGRDDCCVVRSDRNIAAIARTVRRGAASGVASVRQDPNSAAPVSSAITGHSQKFGATEFAR
jgi:hypothetical protein